jgi:hypothetical protein
MSQCILFELSEDCARLVLAKWIRLYEVARLDTAFCSRRFRDAFLELAYNPSTVLTTANTWTRFDIIISRDLERVLDWASFRTARMEGLVIGRDFALYQDSLLAYFPLCGCAIRWVQIDCPCVEDASCSREVMLEIAKWCPNLQQLDVSAVHSVQLWDKHLVALTQSCRKLSEMNIEVSQLSEQGLIDSLNHCECLQRLSISFYNQVIPVDVAIPSLKSFTCRSRCITDAVLYAIGRRCAQLEILIVFRHAQCASEYHITDAGVRAVLQGCPLLRVTDIHNAEHISAEVRVEVVRHCNETVLHLRFWRGMDEELAQRVLMASPNLTHLLCAQHTECVTDTTLAVCAQHCPLVQHISLDRCHRVTDCGVCGLVSSLATLRHVNLGGCPQLTDAVLLALAERCPLLEKLIWHKSTSDATVTKLAEGCSKLRSLDLSCDGIGDSCLLALAAHCKMLRRLSLSWCPNVTMQGARAVVEHCRLLVELVLPCRLGKDHMHISQLAAPGCTVRYL